MGSEVVGGGKCKNGNGENTAPALLSSALLLSLSLFVSFPVDFTKMRVIFGDVTTSDPGIFNWGKGRVALNVIHFDSCAWTVSTHIKSAC